MSIFPSYKFESKVWTLTKHHFRSIDTWLDGICKSFCVEHAWYSDALAIAAAAGKRSIFAEDDDESAGGEDSELEDEEQVVIESCKPATDGELKEQETVCLPQKSFEPEINETGTNGGKFTSEKAEIGSTKRPKRISKLRSSSTSGKEISKSLTSLESIKKSPRDLPRTYYVGKSNGWKLVKAAMDRRGWQQLPFEYQFSNRFGLKWVERRSQIDYRAHVPGQLVCHIPNNDCITTKIGLLYTLKDCFCKQSIGSAAKIHVPWLPETYDLESPADCDALIQAEKSLVRIKKEQSREQAAQTENTSSPSKSSKKSFPLTPSKLSEKQPQEVGGIWIYKPTSNNRGRGIRVLCGLDKLKEACYGSESSDNTNSTPIVKGIVQKYIEKPLLVNREGYKFDIRVYLLIARNYPTTLAFYHPGYCRLSLKPYSLDLNQLEDASVHLTNASIQKKDPIYATLKESQVSQKTSHN